MGEWIGFLPWPSRLSFNRLILFSAAMLITDGVACHWFCGVSVQSVAGEEEVNG